jgi:hypothetical protein
VAAVLWSYRRQYPPAQNFLAADIDKQSLIQTQAAPRLIFIGGSSMAFGVDSARIAEACGRRPVNMGLHAALGLKYMLAEVKPHLREGDWVIVAPEYQQFSKLSGNTEFLVNMLEIAPSHGRFFAREQWSAVFDRGILMRFGKQARAVLKRPGRFFDRATIGKTRPYYRRDGFNANGDVIAHLNVKSPKMSEKEFRLVHDEASVRETVAVLNDFAEFAKQHGARLWFSHAPLPRPIFEENRRAVDELEATLAKEVHIPQLDRAEELVFPYDDFFDTWYHLARPGVEKRTELLATRMSAQAKSEFKLQLVPASRRTS